MSEFEELEERVFALYAGTRFEEIRRTLDGAVEGFPDRRYVITFWQACIDSLLGDPRRALDRLRRGAEEGMFWPDNSLHTDPDLAAARALPATTRWWRPSAGPPSGLLPSVPTRGLLISIPVRGEERATRMRHQG